jgi:hypothetical protein
MIEPLVSFGAVFAMDTLVEMLRPYRMFILPGFFFGFFAVAFVAIALGSRWHARTTFVVFVFSLLIVFNFIVPVTLSPFVSWGHFSNPTPETVHHDEIRIVDANGKELKMDNRATLAFDGISMGPVTTAMVEQDDDEKNEAVAQQLLEDSRAYREEIQTQSSSRFIRFPHHGLTGTWTPDVLQEYDEFVGIRIYRMTYVTSSDGTEIEHYEEEMLLEIYPGGSPPETPRTTNTAPPDSINRTAPNLSNGLVG